MGVIGPGKKVDTYPLPMDQYEKVEFAEIFGMAIAKRIGIGDLLADGTVRFAEKMGRIERPEQHLAPPGLGIHGSLDNADGGVGVRQPDGFQGYQQSRHAAGPHQADVLRAIRKNDGQRNAAL